MVAYSFQQQFVAPIEAGTKAHTIRAPRLGRARHARPGDPITHLVGPRFKPRRFGQSVCDYACEVGLVFDGAHSCVTIHQPPRKWAMKSTSPDKVSFGVVFRGWGPLDFFARADGFTDWAAMEAFWASTHGVPASAREPFLWSGVMIGWKDFQRCA